MAFFVRIIISCVIFPRRAVYAVNVVFIFERMRGGDQVNWRTTPCSGHSSQLFGDILLLCLALFLFNYFHYLSLVISKKDKIKVENFEYLCQNMGWNTFQESFIVQWRSITSSSPVQMVDICQLCRSNLKNKMILTKKYIVWVHLSEHRAGVPAEGLHLDDVVIVELAGIANQPVRLPVPIVCGWPVHCYVGEELLEGRLLVALVQVFHYDAEVQTKVDHWWEVICSTFSGGFCL